MTYERVVVVLCLYLLELCLNPVLRTLIKTSNFVTFYKFLIHIGVHHTYGNKGTLCKNKIWASFHLPRRLRHSKTNEQTIRVQCGTN
jgi:hypothetical protein